MIKQAESEAFGGADLSQHFPFLIWLSYIRFFLFHLFLSQFENLYLFLGKHLIHLGFENYQYTIAQTSAFKYPESPISRIKQNRNVICGWGLGKK